MPSICWRQADKYAAALLFSLAEHRPMVVTRGHFRSEQPVNAVYFSSEFLSLGTSLRKSGSA